MGEKRHETKMMASSTFYVIVKPYDCYPFVAVAPKRTPPERVSVQAQTPDAGPGLDVLGQNQVPHTPGPTQAGVSNDGTGSRPQSLMDTIRMLVPEGTRAGATTNIIHYSLGGVGGLGGLGSAATNGAGASQGVGRNIGTSPVNRVPFPSLCS
jgi:hypothetical protein